MIPRGLKRQPKQFTIEREWFLMAWCSMSNLLPTNDVLFKMIFANKHHPRILIHFLNYVIKPPSLIIKVDIKKTELTPESVSLKGIRLDIVATTDNGEIVNIEMQKKNQKDMASRSLFYWSKVFSGQLQVNTKHLELKHTISISILDFNLFNDDRFLRKYYIKDDETNEKLTDMLEMHLIELNKMKQINDENPITFWIEFFKDPYSEKIKNLCEFVPAIKEAKEVFEKAKADPEAQELIRIQEKATRDYVSDLVGAKSEGIQEGIEKGIEKGRKEAVINMKSKGLDNKLIGECLNITETEVINLLN